jgi:hypothetical protein
MVVGSRLGARSRARFEDLKAASSHPRVHRCIATPTKQAAQNKPAQCKEAPYLSEDEFAIGSWLCQQGRKRILWTEPINDFNLDPGDFSACSADT